MNSTIFSLNCKKLFLHFIFLLFVSSSFSQTKHIVLDEQGIQKVISINTHNNLPEYDGIFSEYTFSVDQLKEASENVSQFSSYIKEYSSVLECSIDVQNLKIIVTTKTNNSKLNDVNENNVAKLKAILDNHNVKMIDYKKIVYCKK